MELKYMTWGAKSYFIVVDDDVQVAEIEVSDTGDSVFAINKTEIYDSENGRGIDTRLVQHILQYARENSLKLPHYVPFLGEL